MLKGRTIAQGSGISGKLQIAEERNPKKYYERWRHPNCSAQGGSVEE